MQSAFISGITIDLRPLNIADADGDYQHWFNDEETCRLNQHHRYPVSRQELIDFVNDLTSSKNKLVLAVIDKQTFSHVGNVSLQNINYINRSAEVANIIPRSTNKSFLYTLESIKLIVTHGFNELNLNRIYGGTLSKHTAIKKIVEMLGFSDEGIARKAVYKNGEYLDVLNVALLKEDFLKNENYR